MDVEWTKVPGGLCLFGDTQRRVTIRTLWWTRTPLTYGNVRNDIGQGLRYPITGVSHAEAAGLAERFGGRLPMSSEWEWMAAGAARRRWPWGNQPWRPELANLLGSGIAAVTEVDAHPEGTTENGLQDVAGNVWEWTASTVMGGGAVIRGGSYSAQELYASCTFLNAAPAELRSPGIGLRVVRES